MFLLVSFLIPAVFGGDHCGCGSQGNGQHYYCKSGRAWSLDIANYGPPKIYDISGSWEAACKVCAKHAADNWTATGVPDKKCFYCVKTTARYGFGMYLNVAAVAPRDQDVSGKIPYSTFCGGKVFDREEFEYKPPTAGAFGAPLRKIFFVLAGVVGLGAIIGVVGWYTRKNETVDDQVVPIVNA